MMRRAVALIVTAFMATGCSKTVEIPRSEIDEPQHREAGSYRIRVKTGEEFWAKRYSTTDSTIVVEELLPPNELRGTVVVVLPLVIKRSDVESIARTRSSAGLAIGVVIFAGVAFLIMFSITKPFDGLGST